MPLNAITGVIFSSSLEAFHLAKQSGDVMLQQYFQLPDSITPTHLTFWSPDKYLCTTAVPIHPKKKKNNKMCQEIFVQLVCLKHKIFSCLCSYFVVGPISDTETAVKRSKKKILNQLFTCL